MYVAITRARERLYFTRSRSRYLYGERSMTLQSRFMNELSSVMEVESPRQSFAQGSPQRRRGSSYGGYGSTYGGGTYGGYGRRSSFSRSARSDEDEFGYRSDLPPEESAPSAGAYASVGHSNIMGVRKNAGTSAQNGGQKDYSKYRAGTKVRHPKFGDGIIVSTRGEGSALVANISFPGVGIKSLSVQIAPLTIVK